jgi:signal peptidase I
MIGLPGESVRIYDGDIFIKPPGGSAEGGTEGDGFSIARKPPFKLLAMMQAVHDTRYFPAALEEARWPHRWNVWPPDNEAPAGAFVSEEEVVESGGAKNVVRRFSTDGSGNQTAWIRYQHIVPDYYDWLAMSGAADEAPVSADELDPRPQLITDYYAYNSDLQLSHAAQSRSLRLPNGKLGLHWIGDLILEADVAVAEAKGELLLDLVEGGRHFRATIDLASGRAEVGIVGYEGFSALGDTPIDEPGTYAIRFANVDDRLLLWVDDDLIDLGGPEGGAPYDAVAVFGGRKRIVPAASADDLGDLAPAGIGSRGAAISVENLRLLRDVYYIADSYDPLRGGEITDLAQGVHQRMVAPNAEPGYREYLSNPEFWPQLFDRRECTFELARDQFFVLGDNSPSSKDSRLWLEGEKTEYGEVKKPGGPYVERRLLTGKALFVYWPHSWGTIPGTGIPLPFFPNVGDMRLVK